MNTKLKRVATLISFSLAALLSSQTQATVYFYYDAEDVTTGEVLPHHQTSGVEFCQTACSGAGARGVVHDQNSFGVPAPQGSKYWAWHIAQGQIEAYTAAKNVSTMPATNIIGKTIYLAVWVRHERINGQDIWNTSGQSTNKHLDIRGNGVRWTIGQGHWDKCDGSYSPGFENNDPHHFSVYGGNATYHLNPSLEEFGSNRNGYTCQNMPQLKYETWNSYVLGITISDATNANGARRLWLNGQLIAEHTNIRTNNSPNPTIDRMELLGTIKQPQYNVAEHYTLMDALMLTDNWQDIIDGGYLEAAVVPKPPSAY